MWTDNSKSNLTSNAQIFAVNSLRQPPPPVELHNSKEDICPIHHEKMTIGEVPLVYQETAAIQTDPTAFPAVDGFPFGAAKIPSPKNTLLPGEPVAARVFQCAACVAARKLADEKQNQAERLRDSE